MIEATLEALGSALMPSERAAVSEQLPLSVRRFLETPAYVPDIDFAAFCDCVGRREAVASGRAREHAQVVCRALAEMLPDETVMTLQQTAVAAYQALELRDYGRVDMRLQADGCVHVIEVNPNPWLSSRAEFAMAGRKSGRTYTRLIEEIVELAMARA